MYIFRWLMKNPIIMLLAYFGVIVLILLSMIGNDAPKSELTDTSKVEPKLEAVKLTEDVAKTEKAVDAPAETMSKDLKATEDQNAQFNEMSADELLLMAREAYWNNGLEESEELYRKLIELNPDVIDYKGELGNVYWRMGEPKKAAALYAEIALPMIEAGDKARVENMVGFIGFHYPETATEIHNALEAK